MFKIAIGQLNVLPYSNPLGMKRFVPSISISFKYECYIIMQMQHTTNLNPERWIGYNIQLAESVYLTGVTILNRISVKTKDF